MKKVAKNGRGTHFARFIFLPVLPLIPSLTPPPDNELQTVIIKAKTRAEIGRILRKYHYAMEVCRHNPGITEADVPKYGYRWLALHNATVQIFTLDKHENYYCKNYDFCYKRAGFLTPEKKYPTMKIFGYQQLS